MKYIVLALALLTTPAALASQKNVGGPGNDTQINYGDTTVNNIDRSRTNNSTNIKVDNSVQDESVNNNSKSKSSATGGDATATGGKVKNSGNADVDVNDFTTNTASVGDTVSESNNTNTSSSDNSNNNTSQGGDVSFDYSYSNVQAENAASSAASTFVSYCQRGASAQGFDGGFTVSDNDAFCDRIRLADHYWVVYDRQLQLLNTFQCAMPAERFADRCAITEERAMVALDKAWTNTEEANELIESGEFAAKVERTAGPFARIGGILMMLLVL